MIYQRKVMEAKSTSTSPKSKKSHTQTTKKSESISAAAPKKMERNFSKSFEIHHDLYKLEVSKMSKNMGLPGKNFHIEEVEHCHFFHTVDSDGREQFYSTPVGGHFHKMEIIEQGNDNPPIVRCASGPLQWARQKDRMTGKFRKVAVPAGPKNNGAPIDTHTHNINYLYSEVVKAREVKPQAVELIRQEAQKGAPIDGIIG